MNGLAVNAALLRQKATAFRHQLGPFPSEEIKKLDGSALGKIRELPSNFEKYFSLMSILADPHGQDTTPLSERRVLDFGCGLGVFIAQAHRLGMESKGVDTFDEYGGSYHLAESVVRTVIGETQSTAQAQLFKLDLLDEASTNRLNQMGEFDFTTSFGMLEHIHGCVNQELILKHMMSTLKPGGWLILTCGPNARFPVDLFHYGPIYPFYHQLPVSLRGVYAKLLFAKPLNQDPKWLNGMDVGWISRQLYKHGASDVMRLFPQWVEASDWFGSLPSLAKAFVRRSLGLLQVLEAEPVIIMVARKREQRQTQLV